MQQQEREAVPHSVLAALEGAACAFCETGELVRDTYKGNAAVICEACETPGAQVW